MNYEKIHQEQEAAQELAERQMREIINLNADCRQRQKRLAAAARQRTKARRQAAAKAERRTLAGFLALGVFAVGVLGYLIGIGEGLRVLVSLAISIGILLAVLLADKIRSKSRRGKYERV